MDEGLPGEALGLGSNEQVVPVVEVRTEDAAGVLKPTAVRPDAGVMQMELWAESDSLFAQLRN